MSTFNGIGTTFYGATDIGPDGSYVTTDWFVIVYLPIFPLTSYRVIKEDSTNLIVYSSQRYKIQKVGLHKNQVLKTYSWTYGIIAAVILIINLFG